MKTVKLRECVPAAMGEPANGEPIVRGCKILGLDSKNNRRYLREAVVKGVPLYEGVGVYFDHDLTNDGNGVRPFLAKFGRLENARVDETGCLRADFRFNPKHVYADTFRGWLETDSKGIGFSHNATGRVQEGEDGMLIVEEIVAVDSVDLVSRPATTEGLMEHVEHKGKKKTKRVREMDDELVPDLEMPEPDAVVDDAAPADVGHEEHLADAVRAIFADATMSNEDKLAKIKALFKVLDVDAPAPAEEEAVPEEEDEEEEKEDDEVKEAHLTRMIDRAVGKAMAKRDKHIERTITEAIGRATAQAKVKTPQSRSASPANVSKLTVDSFLAGM